MSAQSLVVKNALEPSSQEKMKPAAANGRNSNNKNASADEDDEITVIDEDDFNNSSRGKKLTLEPPPQSQSQPLVASTFKANTITKTSAIVFTTPIVPASSVSSSIFGLNSTNKLRTFISTLNNGNKGNGVESFSSPKKIITNHPMIAKCAPKTLVEQVDDGIDHRQKLLEYLNKCQAENDTQKSKHLPSPETRSPKPISTPPCIITPINNNTIKIENEKKIASPVKSPPSKVFSVSTLNQQQLQQQQQLKLEEPKLESDASSKTQVVCRRQTTRVRRERTIMSKKATSFDETKPLANTTTTTTTTTTNSKKIVFTGLRNLGSTCYINVIIQVMRHTPGFALRIHRLNRKIDYLETLNNEIKTEINENLNISFVRNLHELLVEMSEKEKLDRRPIYTPRKFVSAVWNAIAYWADGSQQDAHEFLNYTILFINNCDQFIRKLEHTYKIKSIPASFEADKTTATTTKATSIPLYRCHSTSSESTSNRRSGRPKQSGSAQQQQKN